MKYKNINNYKYLFEPTRLNDFNVDRNLLEQTKHGNDVIPVGIYYRKFDVGTRDNVILHWHDELQLSFVTEGEVLFCVNGKEYDVKKGNGIFINSRRLHSAQPLSGIKSGYICIDVHASVIYGILGSRVHTEFVEPFLLADSLTAIHFNGEEKWHDVINQQIEELYRLTQAQEYGCELEIKACILRIWAQIARANRPAQDRSSNVAADFERMEVLIKYIDDNFAEKLLLEDIASQASISEGECCRMFKRNIHVSPIEYLINVRIANSIDMLVNTDMSIAQIANEVGFASSSYYTERFRKIILCTPTEYRKSHIRSLKEKFEERL